MPTFPQLITHHLDQLNLNFHPSIIPHITSFFDNDVGFINNNEPEQQIYAAAAIISETEELPTYKPNQIPRNGIMIENVMSHLGSVSKEQFLTTLSTQIQKVKNHPHSVKLLKKRVQDIRYAYRFFKKYKQSFEALYTQLLPAKLSTKDDFCAMFWLLFLHTKNSSTLTQSITESKLLLITLLGMVFGQFLCQAGPLIISPQLSKHIGTLSWDKSDEEYQDQKISVYKSLIRQKLNFFYSQRFSEQTANFKKLLDNYTFVQRLVDDMSNAFKKEQSRSQVDELSFLELKKDLTPQVFRKVQIEVSIEPIKTALLFDDDQLQEQSEASQEGIGEEQSQEDEYPTVGYTIKEKPHLEEPVVTPPSTPKQHTPTNSNITSPISTPKWFCNPSIEPICPEMHFDTNLNATPITKKCQNEQWMRKKIQKCSQEQLRSFEQMMNSIEDTRMQIQKDQKTCRFFQTKLSQLIKDFTPKCLNPTQRMHQMLSFIVSNLNQLTPQEAKFPPPKKTIDGIICLSCELFNYVNNSVTYEYRHHCELFGVDCSVAYEMLEMFMGKIAGGMPLDLQEYLKKLKKRFFVCDLWEGQHGYDIIRNYRTNPHLQPIYQAIVAFSTSRIKQICLPCSIQPKITTKTTNMIHYLFDHKSNLFQYNNLDQLILCCLMSCLSINQKQEHRTLELLFYQYTTNIQFSFNSNQQGLKDSNGKQMKIVQYYNDVFLQQIKDMLTVKFQQIDDFLLTPVRISKSLTVEGMGKRFSSLKQDSMKKENKVGLFRFNPERVKDSKASYLQNLVKQSQEIMNQEMKEQKDEQDKEDIPSPNFGMPRLFSFKKPSEQK